MQKTNTNSSHVDIYGVEHSTDFLSETLQALSDEVTEHDIVGIEPSPQVVAIFEQVKEQALDINKGVQILRQKYEEYCRAQGHEPDNKEQFDTWEYWYRVWYFLSSKTEHIVGVGSEIRKRLLKEGHNNAMSLVVTLPHFNAHIARKIEQHNITKVVVGDLHALVLNQIAGYRAQFSSITNNGGQETRERAVREMTQMQQAYNNGEFGVLPHLE